jgi:transmembrane sensor
MQENREKIDKEMLLRYLKGSGSTKDEIIIHNWLDNIELENQLNEESLLIWNEINPDESIHKYEGDHILDRIHHKINIDEAMFLNNTKQKIGIFNYLTKISAILVLPLIVTSLLLFFQNRTMRNTVSWVEINAPFGTRTNFNLPDGSTGFLNGGSSLRFPTQFVNSVRDVKLTGEACFDVVSNPKKPFIVSTENIDVKVTGTSFNVMAYANEHITEVTLKHGKVEIFKKKDGATKSMGLLKPEESFLYNSWSDSGKIESVNSADKLSWVDGKLAFKYEPFEEVIKKLNRWYNVNIVLKDQSLVSYTYYGTFQNETLDEVLKLLKYTAPIRYKDIARKTRQDGTFEKRKIEIYYKN